MNIEYPNFPDIEKLILGTVILESESMNDAIGLLRDTSFYDRSNRALWKVLQEMYAEREPIDPITVTNQCRHHKLEKARAWTAYEISNLTAKINSSAHLVKHCRILQEAEFKRIILDSNQASIREIQEGFKDVFDIIDHENNKINYITSQLQNKKQLPLRDLINKNLKWIEMARKNETKITGVPSGFRQLDAITAGWQKTDLIVVAARPGMGKTSFILSMARHQAKMGLKVVIISIEMVAEQLVLRLQSIESEIPLERIRKGDVNAVDFDQIITNSGELAQLEDNIIIRDPSNLTILELRAMAYQLKKELGEIDIMYLDYMQLMSGRNESREQEIAVISRGLKGLAKELDLPVVAISQLSRATETRGGSKRPQLSDLRESGSIEQDADLVVFLYRAEYYKFQEDEDGNDTTGIAEVNVAKHRNGRIDTIRLRFRSELTKFDNLDGWVAPFKKTTPDEMKKKYDQKSVEKDDNNDLPF